MSGEPQKSSTESLIVLLTEHQERLFRYIFSLVACEADARDILQETSVALYRKFDAYDAARPFLPWAYRFAYLEVQKHREKTARSPLLFSEDVLDLLAHDRAQMEPELDVRLRLMDWCLAKLTPQDKELVTSRYALRQGAATVPIDNLPGYPDNLTRAPSGRIWVGLTKPRSPVLDYAASRPWVRSFTLRLPRALWPVPKAYGHIIAFEDSGRIVDDMQDPKGGYPETTSATEIDGKLFVQSLHAPSLAWLPYRGPGVPVPADDGSVERIVGGAPQVRTSP